MNIAFKKDKIVEALQRMQELDDALETHEERIAAEIMFRFARRIFWLFTGMYLFTVSREWRHRFREVISVERTGGSGISD